MNKIVKTLIAPLAVLVSVAGINISTMSSAYANDLALNLCTYVQGDDRVRMRNKLREDRVRLRQVYGDVVCNGMSLIQFAAHNSSNEIADFMISQLQASTIESYNYLEWMDENGYSDSEIVVSINNRIN